ncbi:MAG: hypothetical protein NZ700_06485 [Gemmataceae bacterium]|nr:hypothetical protein [Gemmataceae bacterium]MDW8266583.1 hypothetical protein [Gemmataceae bacterium]
MEPSQLSFLESLTKEGREQSVKERAGKNVPSHVEFVCVVGNGAGVGDGVVHCRSQWTEDLQRQGIPAVALSVSHFMAMRSTQGAALLAALVRDKQPRWDADKVAAVRRELLGRR